MSARTMNRSAFASVAFLVASSALAQMTPTSTLKGLVHGEDGSAIAGASVTIESPQLAAGVQSVTTDSKGVFRFEFIEPGEYTVTVERSHYTPLRSEHLLPPVGATLELDVTLTASAVAEVPGVGPGLPAGAWDARPAIDSRLVVPAAARPMVSFGMYPAGFAAMSCASQSRTPQTATRPTTMLGDPPASLTADRRRLAAAQPRH